MFTNLHHLQLWSPATLLRGVLFWGAGGSASLSEPNGDVPLDGVAFSLELYLNWVAHFRIFGLRNFFTFTVSKRTRMFVL